MPRGPQITAQLLLCYAHHWFTWLPQKESTEKKTFLGGITVSSTWSVFVFYIQLHNKENSLIQRFLYMSIQVMAFIRCQLQGFLSHQATTHSELAGTQRSRQVSEHVLLRQCCPHAPQPLLAPGFAAQIFRKVLQSCLATVNYPF